MLLVLRCQRGTTAKIRERICEQMLARSANLSSGDPSRKMLVEGAKLATLAKTIIGETMVEVSANIDAQLQQYDIDAIKRDFKVEVQKLENGEGVAAELLRAWEAVEPHLDDPLRELLNGFVATLLQHICQVLAKCESTATANIYISCCDAVAEAQ